MRLEDLQSANDRYRAGFAYGHLPTPPGDALAIVTCMDSRIEPLAVLGLDLGSAHIIRNAGAVATDDVERSLTVSQRKLGTRSVLVLVHTGCGLLDVSEDDMRAELMSDVGMTPPWALGALPSLKEAVQASVRRLRTSPFLPHRGDIAGGIYDVASGAIEFIDVD